MIQYKVVIDIIWGDEMDNFLFWFILAIILLICVVVPVAVTQIAQIGWILGKNGDDEE